MLLPLYLPPSFPSPQGMEKGCLLAQPGLGLGSRAFPEETCRRNLGQRPSVSCASYLW